MKPIMDEIIILKLGGSLLTDKSEPFSIREKIIKQSVKEIIKSKKKVIIVHGGGSFGHPVAKRYKISQGLNHNVENQIYGIAKTHEAMLKLNSILTEICLNNNYPVIAIQPFSVFVNTPHGLKFINLESVKLTLDLGITPILYGDVILDHTIAFTILSGDLIILELCRKLSVSKVVFAIEKDGVFIDKDGKPELIEEILSSQIDGIKLASLDKKIDITGGIMAKLKIIKLISNLNIPVQILNGLKEKNIYKSLLNRDVKSTNIYPS